MCCSTITFWRCLYPCLHRCSAAFLCYSMQYKMHPHCCVYRERAPKCAVPSLQNKSLIFDCHADAQVENAVSRMWTGGTRIHAIQLEWTTVGFPYLWWSCKLTQWCQQSSLLHSLCCIGDGHLVKEDIRSLLSKRVSFFFKLYSPRDQPLAKHLSHVSTVLCEAACPCYPPESYSGAISDQSLPGLNCCI